MIVEQKQVSTDKSEARVLDLGLVDYQSALDLQTDLRDRRIAGEIPDTLVLLEHLPVITLGRSGNMENILVPESELADRGIQFFHANRGETSLTTAPVRSSAIRSWTSPGMG